MKKQVPKLQPRNINAPIGLEKIKEKKTKSSTCCWCIFYLFCYFSPAAILMIGKLISWMPIIYTYLMYNYSLFMKLNNHFINNFSLYLLDWLVVVKFVEAFLLKLAQCTHVISLYIVLTWTWIFRFFQKCSTICPRTKNWIIIHDFLFLRLLSLDVLLKFFHLLEWWLVKSFTTCLKSWFLNINLL